MLDRLFEEGRLNNEYRSAFEHAAYALLREEGMMEVIERTVYKKLFGEDPKDKENDAKNAKSTLAPKKRNEKDIQEARDSIESDITKLVASISYRDQAAKTPPPEEKPQFTERQKRVMVEQEIAKAKMGVVAWHRLREANEKNTAIAARHDAMLFKRDDLLPMRTGGSIQQFSTYAPPTRECENYWFAEDRAQIKMVEQRLNVSVKYISETWLFRLWPVPADRDAFEKDRANGMQLLARCKEFLQFWVWVFIYTDPTRGRASLTTCLEWFLFGETSLEYKEFVRFGFHLKVNDAH
ncbi:hypothetical protein ACHAPF_004936 [Botrytis cinerea]